MGGGSDSSTQTSTSTSKSSPVYNPRVLPLFQAETNLVRDTLFPLEGGILRNNLRLMNPDTPLSVQQQESFRQDQGLAGQVGQYMPGSAASQDFMGGIPQSNEMALRQNAPLLAGQIGRSLIDPRFQGLLGPTGQLTESTSTGAGGGAGGQTAQMVMSGIGTAAAVAGTVAMIAA